MADKYQKEIINFLFANELPHETDFDDGFEYLMGAFDEIDYYHDFNEPNTLRGAQFTAEQEEKAGKSLYMVTDDPDQIVFLVMPKEYFVFVNLIKKNLGFDFLNKFNAVDLAP